MDDHDPTAAGLAAANRFFDGLLVGDLAALEAACAPDSILWINLSERERPLEGSLAGFASLRSKVPDLHLEDVRRRVPGAQPVLQLDEPSLESLQRITEMARQLQPQWAPPERVADSPLYRP